MDKTRLRLGNLISTSLAIIGFWIIGGILATAIEAWRFETFFGASATRNEIVLLGLLRAAFWAVMTPVVMFVADRMPVQKPHVLRKVLVLVPVILLLAMAREALGASGYQFFSGMAWDPSEIVLAWNLRLDVNFVIVAAMFAMFNLARIQKEAVERKRVSLELEGQLAQAQLNQLRADIQPHFLFNALNGITALVHAEPDKAERMLIALSALLRRSLELRKPTFITLEDELSVACDYLDLVRMRFEDRLTFDIDVDDELLDALVPPLILQPLVENAVKHGALERGDEAVIRIRGGVEDGRLHIQIADNGAILRQGSPGAGGMGLSTTRRRLELLFHEKASLELIRTEDEVITDLLIPIVSGGNDGPFEKVSSQKSGTPSSAANTDP